MSISRDTTVAHINHKENSMHIYNTSYVGGPSDVSLAIKHKLLAESDVDLLLLEESFVVEDSIFTIATQIRKQISQSRLIGCGDSIAIAWENGWIGLDKHGSDPTVSVKGIVVFTIVADPEFAQRILSYMKREYTKHQKSSLNLWYMTRDGPTNVPLFIEKHGQYLPEFYPWAEPDFFDRYLASDASILFLIGPPGTGKTSYLRHQITQRGISVVATYDEEVLKSDKMFIEYVSSSSQNMMVIEDADNILTTRSRAPNNLIARFLNFSDGLAKMPKKKMVFSTNLSDFSSIDEALTREGRCFGALYTRKLTANEAFKITQLINDNPPDVREYTLAELLNRQSKPTSSIQLNHRKVGF